MRYTGSNTQQMRSGDETILKTEILKAIHAGVGFGSGTETILSIVFECSNVSKNVIC